MFFQIDEEGDRVKGGEEFGLLRHPASVFGTGQNAAIKFFPVTALDRTKVLSSDYSF